MLENPEIAPRRGRWNMRFAVRPVGVKLLGSVEGFEGVTGYRGVSYCDAVRRAASGEELLLEPAAIETCRWSPVVLGLKPAESDFERSLQPRFDYPVAGFYIAILDRFRPGTEPDVVIVRDRPAVLSRLADSVGEGGLQRRYRDGIGASALGVLEKRLSPRVLLSHASNRLVRTVMSVDALDRLLKKVIAKESVSSAVEKLLKNTVADMSMCRNSTVIPCRERAGNISYFCTGGAGWGDNDPSNMTSGWPYRLIEPYL